MRSTFKILFFLKKVALKSDGTAPIMARITISGTVAHFHTKLFVYPHLWNSSGHCVIGRTDEAKKINSELKSIESSLDEVYRLLQKETFLVTAESVKTIFLGFQSKITLCYLYSIKK